MHASGDEAGHINKQTKIAVAAEPASAQPVIKDDEQPVAPHEQAPEPQQQQTDATPQTVRQDEETPGKLI